MNTNLNNIPLEIFLDYCTETTGQEWTLEFFFTAYYSKCRQNENCGEGFQTLLDTPQNPIQFHYRYSYTNYGGYETIVGCGYSSVIEGYGNIFTNKAFACGYGYGYGNQK